jgi:hypothetical protein
MKTLSKSSKFYQTVLNHFRKQYKDVVELTSLEVTADNKICGGEWIDSKGVFNIGHSIDAVNTIKITN